jgi:hypothetical protein
MRYFVRKLCTPIATAALLGLAAGSASADGPAVSQTNLKVTAAAGSVESESAWYVSAGLTAPLSERWGFQAEVGTAGVDSDTFSGVGGHVFTRDPDKHLFGLFAAYASEDSFDLDATRLGAEAELYYSQVTLLAKAGYQFSEAFGDSAFADVELRWYISNNLALSGGAAFADNASAGRVGAEWMPAGSALPGLALRVDATFGENEFDSVLGGITYYFGGDASLKDHHRKQDPDSALFTLFQAVQQQEVEYCTQHACGAPPPPVYN